MSTFPNLNLVITPPYLIRPRCRPPVPFLTGEDMAFELVRCDHIDVLTYSTSPNGLPVNRMIYVEGNPPRHCKHAIRVTGTHAKLWIGYRDEIPTAYVGSANASANTLFELVYRATKRQSRDLANYFDHIWKLNLPKK